MKNILVCTRDLDFGVGSVVKNELNIMDKDKSIGRVVVIGPKILEGYSSKIVFKIIKNKGKFFITKEPNFALKCNRKIKEVISREKIDEIQLHFPILAENFGVKIISKFHNLHLSIIKNHPKNFNYLIASAFHKIYSYFDYSTIKNSEKVLFVSRRTLEEARIIYPKFKDKFFYSPNFVDSSKFYKLERKDIIKIEKNFGLNEKKFNILYVGRLEQMKGIQNLISVLKYLDSSKFRLLIIGDGPLKEFVKKYSFVEYLGRIPNQELYKYYNLADLFILPSLYENSPMTLLEAKSCGCKILASNTGDNEYIIGRDFIFNNNKELKDKLSLMLK